MPKLDPVQFLLNTLQDGENRRLASYRWGLPIGWVVTFTSLIAKSVSVHDAKAVVVELVIGVIPFAIGGLLWWRHRQSALEEARRVRSPLNLP